MNLAEEMPAARNEPLTAPEAYATHKPAIYVEVGPGLVPYTSTGTRTFDTTTNSKYVGIDNGARSALHESDPDNEFIAYHKGNLADAKFEDGSVREVFLANFFGDPKISNHDKEAALAEAARILEPGGSVVIFESTTPAASLPSLHARLKGNEQLIAKAGGLENILVELGLDDMYQETGLQKLIQASGLDVVQHIKPGQDGWDAMMETYRSPQKMSSLGLDYLKTYPDDYFMVLQKTQAIETTQNS